MLGDLTPTTELEAVNYLLMSIGEQPINDINVDGIAEISIAKNFLHSVSRHTQSRGLNCNSEKNYPLARDIDNKVPVPSNTIKIDASDSSLDIVRRGGFLYNKAEHTFIFKDTVEVDIVFFLQFNDLPQVVRDYVVVRASRLFQTKVLGSETLHAFSAQDEQQAWINLMSAEIDSEDLNILGNISVIENLRRN